MKKPVPRFNKSAVILYAQRRVESLCKQYGFDQGNGTAQLHGKTVEVNRAVAYGQMDVLRTLIEEIQGGYITDAVTDAVTDAYHNKERAQHERV